jgi:broad specificity phosphatase PhoE
MGPMKILLIRHGQTEWNRLGRAQGHTDTPLDDEGLRQARLLADSLVGHSVATVWTSDLARALTTAEHVQRSVGGELVATPLLRERSFGTAEGSMYGELRQAADAAARAEGVTPEAFRVAPGAESEIDVWQRIVPWADEVVRTDASIAVVSHGGTCGLLLARWLGGDFTMARRFRFGNTAVTEFEVFPLRGPVLLRYNDTRHLDQPSAPMIDLHHVGPNP